MTLSTAKEAGQLADLHEVFLNFETKKIDGCEVVYLNSSLAGSTRADAILAAYSYVIKPGEQGVESGPLNKTFMAERYGGDGILSNGGGGRCGFDGVWQLKGLGPNPLVGHDVDPGHGDGNLSLDTAIYESIWAEIIQAVLPFGATRTVAILDTGQVYTSYKGVQKRGLLIRQPVVRPAHFIRSVYFRQKRLDSLGEDAQRVKDVIHKLVEFLPASVTPGTAESLDGRLENGLVELAGRYAKQFAASHAKHIIHYNVSASNVSINGAWLDLSGVCLFTDFVNCDRLSIDRFNNEYVPALQSIQSLCYYLSKYAVATTEACMRMWDAAAVHFSKTYAQHLNLYQVAQAGFPLWLLQDVQDSSEFLEFASCLDTVLKLDDFTVTPVWRESGWDGYARWTARLYSVLLTGLVNEPGNVDLSWLNTDKASIDLLCKRYTQLFEKAANAALVKHINRKNLYRCMVINATRLNRSHRLLHEMEGRIASINGNLDIDRKAAYEALAAEAVLAAAFNLGNEPTPTVPFWLSEGLSIWFEPASGTFRLVGGQECTLTAEALHAQSARQGDIEEALNFYGRTWSEIDEEVF